MEFMNDYWFFLLAIALTGLSIGWLSEGSNLHPVNIFLVKVTFAALVAMLFTIKGVPFLTSAIFVAFAIALGKSGYYFAESAWVRPNKMWSVVLPAFLTITAIITTFMAFSG